MNKRIFAIILLLAATVTIFAIPGDINGDGVLDIADLARLEAMVSGKVDSFPGADVNLDSEIDKADILLLIEAITKGKPLPTLLAWEQIGYWQENANISAGGLTVDFPCTSYTSQQISFSTIDQLPDFNIELPNGVQMTPPVIVTNLPGRPSIETATFTLDVPKEHNDDIGAPMLLVGFYTPDRLQEEPPKWKYCLFPALEEYDVAYADRKLTWTPDFALTEGFESTPICLAVIYTTVPATRGTRSAAEEPEKMIRDDFYFEKCDSFWDMSSYGRFQSTHFIFTMEVPAGEKQMKPLARDFEKAYEDIGKIGMPQKFKDKWGHDRIPVNIIQNPMKEAGQEDKSQDAQCVGPGFLHYPYIDVPFNVLKASQRAETCCHELMHYHQYYYAAHATALFMEEMIGTWSEYLISPNGNEHMPNNYVFGRAPINGLYFESWAETRFNQYIFRRGQVNHAGEHGYNLVPFARWLTQVKYPQAKYPGKKLWPAVFGSAAYASGDGIGALQAGIKAMDATDSLATLYPEFMYDYFAEKPGIPMKSKAWQLFFDTRSAQEGIDRYGETGLVTNIKSAGEMFQEGNYSHTFQIQNYGAATWMLRYYRVWDYLEDYTNAVVTFSLPEGADSSIMDFKFLAMDKAKNKIELKPFDSVKIDAEKNTASIVFPLESLAVKPENPNNAFFNFIGVVAVFADDQSPADRRRALTMSVAYDGPIVLKDLVATMPGIYDPNGLMKTNMNLAVTPLDGLGLQFNGLEAFNEESSGQHIKFTAGIATVMRPAITQETEVTLNLTGAIQDISSQLKLSGKQRPEPTGQFMLKIHRGETGAQGGIPVPWTVVGGEGEYGNETTQPLSMLVPVAPSKRSNFTIRFKVAPPPDGDANCSYSISLYPIYHIYDKKDSYYIHTPLAGGLSIKILAAPKKPPQQ